MQEEPASVPVKFPVATILSVLATLLLVHALSLVAPLILPLLISVLIAVSLTPCTTWLEKKNISRGVAVAIVALGLGLLVLILCALILPDVYRQARTFAENLPEFRAQLLKAIGNGSLLYEPIATGLNKEVLVPKAEDVKQVLVAGNMLLSGLAEFVFIFVMTVYLVAEGPRIVEWLSAFFDHSVQKKIKQTANEMEKIISAYVLGQFVTSLLSFLFVLFTLMMLGVPNSLLLATLSGILDILPILGFVLAVIPAMLFAASVSATMPWAVLVAYVVYHVLENYLIVPWIYGKRMRVSSFVVFFSLIASGLIGGIEGAIVVLPIVAAYPIVERIWLRRYVRKEALVEHAPK